MSARRDRNDAKTGGLTRRRVIQTTAGMLAGGALLALPRRAPGQVGRTADLILHNGQITTLNPARPSVTAVAIEDGLIAAVGADREARGTPARCPVFQMSAAQSSICSCRN
jgi:hypothetical protein